MEADLVSDAVHYELGITVSVLTARRIFRAWRSVPKAFKLKHSPESRSYTLLIDEFSGLKFIQSFDFNVWELQIDRSDRRLAIQSA